MGRAAWKKGAWSVLLATAALGPGLATSGGCGGDERPRAASPRMRFSSGDQSGSDGGLIRGFTLPIDSVTEIPGRGVAVIGTIRAGRVQPGDLAEIRGGSAPILVTVVSIERFGRQQASATAGDMAGIVVSGVERSQVQRGYELVGLGPSH